ncbi:uncharacterized protein LOC110175441 isoform X2 [Boleophthalmus pectinirostris]|uniref:uncharacterized protein LOC110175441 isoform X2 n=1 Tax=Boleophthalmus pectinirostris TaxID=150288 RepID=UPI002432255D|nr:uncharacterized protein LOC110175441 isoform X2 [Boleophthalmus pectinirostris]
MVYLIFLIVGIILCETSGFNLNCTNDYETLMSCHIDARNCAELRMTLNDTKKPRKTCSFHPCVGGCCCKMEMTDNELSIGNAFTAEVYENRQGVHKQTIKIYETIKPKTPTIISVDKLNGLYRIQWKTNAKMLMREELSAIVTYQKKGDNTKNIIRVKPSQIKDMNNCEILGRDLEPNTTYVVNVITYTNSNVFSDSSQEVEFTTDSSQNGLFIAAIISLCVIAIAVSGVSFVSFIKLKGKLWDKAARVEKPNLLNIKHKKEVILTPELLSVYSLSVEPLISKDSLMLSKESLSDSSGRSGQSSGMSSASSSLGYANTQPFDSEAGVLEALQNAFPLSIPSTDTLGHGEPRQNWVIRPDESLVTFENESYISTLSPQTTDDVDRQEMGDSGYHSSDAPPLQDFIIPTHVSTTDIDMSYHPCTLSEDASNDLSPQKSLPVVYGCHGLEKVQQSNNALSEHNNDCQVLLSGLTNISKTSEVGHFQIEIPHVSNEMIVDSGYHCV